jgi:uncharacterized protein
MSSITSIPFLENVHEGQNNWWKYLLTVILSLIGGSILAGILSVIIVVLYAFTITSSGNVAEILGIMQETLQNPFILIALIGLSYAISFLIFYICLRFLHHKRLIALINTVSSFRWKLLFKGLLLWIVVLSIFSIPDLIFNFSSYQKNFDIGSLSILLILCLLVFPFQASFEEILFRGYLMQGFSLLSKKPWVPILITSLIFGSVHILNGTDLYMDLSIVASTFIMGIMLGIIAVGENGIETAMGIHIANNLYVSLLFNSADSGLGEVPSLITAPASDPFSGLPFMILISVITLTVLFWNRKDDLVRIFR